MIKKPLNLPFFKRQVDKIIKDYPKEEENIKNLLQNIPLKKADRFPGFNEHEVYKLRYPLKKYNISKSKGLRIVFYKHGDDIYPFAFYMHKDYKPQSEAQMIRENFKKMIKALKEQE